MNLVKIVRSFLYFLFAVMVLVIGVFWILDLYHGTNNNAEYATGVGTIILAFITQNLVFNEIDEGQKNRRRDRIKEQLEGLYSPLMADIDNFNDDWEHDISSSRNSFGNLNKDNESYIYKTMSIIRSNYEFLAEPVLKNQLKEYYTININKRYGIENIENFKLLLPKIQETIKKEYKELSDEYEKLVKSR